MLEKILASEQQRLCGAVNSKTVDFSVRFKQYIFLKVLIVAIIVWSFMCAVCYKSIEIVLHLTLSTQRVFYCLICFIIACLIINRIYWSKMCFIDRCLPYLWR